LLSSKLIRDEEQLLFSKQNNYIKGERNMKKMLCFLLVIIMLMGLSACSSSDSGGNSSNPDQTSTPENKGDFVVDFFMYDSSNTFAGMQRLSIIEQLEQLGVTYNDYDAGGDQATQLDQIHTAISKGSDFLIVCPAEPSSDDAMREIVEAARDAGIPVEMFLRKPSTEILESYEQVSYVGSDEYGAGLVQAEILWSIMGDNLELFDRNGDGKISYMLLYGQLGHDASINRTEAVIKSFNNYLTTAGWPELSYYDSNNQDKFSVMNWSIAEAYDMVTTALQTNPMTGTQPIELIISNNDDGAVGAVQALQDVGWNTGKEGDPYIPVVGVDASPIIYDALIANQVQGSVLQDSDAVIKCLMLLLQNSQDGKELLDGIETICAQYGWSTDNGGHYLVIPFTPFDAEDAKAALAATE